MATEIKYNGNIIATPEAGKTVTIKCASKKMKTDLIIKLAEQSATLESYDGKVTITKKVNLDPEFNHYGVIPEGCEYNLYDWDTGEDNWYYSGDAFPDITANGSHQYRHYDLLYVYYPESNSWVAEDHVVVLGENAVILESINTAPVTTIEVTYQATGRGNYLEASTTCVAIPKSITLIKTLAFDNYTALTNITYTGTVEQWNSIDLEDGWNRYCPEITVTCTDGTITIPAYGS